MLLIELPITGHAEMTTDESVQRRLESQGYKAVKDIKFTSEGITATAIKRQGGTATGGDASKSNSPRATCDVRRSGNLCKVAPPASGLR
jgi:hypothetical protein